MKLLVILMFLLGCSDISIYGGETEYVEVLVYDQLEDPESGEIWVEHFVQPTTSNGTDVLWVLDFSCSMSNDQDKVIAGIQAMISALPESGWRLNMVATDPYNALIEDQFPLVPGDTGQEALDMYNSLHQGQGEMGLEAVYQYIEMNPASNFWMREDATLLVVFVTDESDYSFDWEVPDWLDWYRLIRPPGSVFCAGVLNPSDNARYETVISSLGGVEIDIRSEDWTMGVADAAIQVFPYEAWTLAHEPMGTTLVVFVDGEPFLDWLYNPEDNRIEFTVIPPEGSLVEISYILN